MDKRKENAMATTEKSPVLVVLQLSGGNDYMNTVIPYNDPLYRDYRPRVAISEDQILPLDDQVGLHPSMGPLREIYNQGKMAIIHGVGYPNSVRSHFRSMDIWHTCEPDKTGTEGWLGLATRALDPAKENIVTAVSFGPCMFRALAVPGVPVACVDDLETYGLLTGISPEPQRAKILERFAQNYSPLIGTDEVMKYLGSTGLEAMEGADILKVAPQRYASTVKYPETSIAKKLKGIAQIHFANLGSRVFYCDHLGFDTHANQLGVHATLWNDVSTAIEAFFADLKEHHASEEVLMLLFTEFGRRVRDNGSGTDHGAGGAAFVIGDAVKGGQYSEYPSRKAEDLTQGDLAPTIDFRGLYSTILEDWLHVDAKPIVKGSFEKPRFL
jgi:uncharacterized protein (DUF1501 family)